MGKGDVKINGNQLNQIIFESVKKILKEYWTDADTALENATKEAEAELVQKFIVWAEQHKGERTSPVRRVFFGDETEGDSAEIDGNEFYWYKLVNVPGEWRVEWWQVPGRLTNEKGNWVGAWTNHGPGKEMGLKDAILGLYSDYSEEADNTVRLNESQLRKLIRESVRNVLMEMDEIAKDKVMPGKYMQIFKNRIENAIACSEDIKATVSEFYNSFKTRVPSKNFTLKNLLELAENIGGEDHRTHERGDMEYGHKIKDAEGWWGMNSGKFLEEDSNHFEYKDAYVDNRTAKTKKLNESQILVLISESVKRVLKEIAGTDEISSEKWAEISNSIHKNYGGADFPGPKATRFDDNGNPIYGKKGKTVASLYRKLDAAKNDALAYEKANRPASEWDDKAIQITQDYEPYEEEAEMDGGWHYLYDTWYNLKTEDGVWPIITLTLREDEPLNVYYIAPDGTEGDIDL